MLIQINVGQKIDIGHFNNEICQIQYVKKLLASISVFPKFAMQNVYQYNHD
jgi:hypothetical protein